MPSGIIRAEGGLSPFGKMPAMWSSVINRDPSRITSSPSVSWLKATMVPPDKRIEEAAARLGARRSCAERREGNIFQCESQGWEKEDSG